MFGNYGGGARSRNRFEQHYQCYSTAFSGRTLDDGDKVLLPASALDTLARMQVDYPMLFRLEHEEIGKRLHCGVLEFTAEEGHCYLPFWMMENLLLEEGSILKVTNVTLPKATFVKFRAQSVDFLEIQNPKVALEVTLRKFTCLTVGEIIRLDISRKVYLLEVVELQPGEAASIIETDCITDFAEPVGYVEPKRVFAPEAAAGAGGVGGAVRVPQKAKIEGGGEATFKPFAGQAKRIDGKGESGKADAKDVKESQLSPSSSSAAPLSAPTSSVFGGVGRTLKDSSGTLRDSRGTSGFAAGGGGADGGAQSSGGSSSPRQHQSRIGDQFSKRRTQASAFTGPGHKLN